MADKYPWAVGMEVMVSHVRGDTWPDYVVRLTPTQVVIESGARFDRATGWMRGDRETTLRPLTNADRVESQRRMLARVVGRLSWIGATLDQLRRVQAIHEEEKR